MMEGWYLNVGFACVNGFRYGESKEWNVEGGEKRTGDRCTYCQKEKSNRKTNMGLIFFRLQWL